MTKSFTVAEAQRKRQFMKWVECLEKKGWTRKLIAERIGKSGGYVSQVCDWEVETVPAPGTIMLFRTVMDAEKLLEPESSGPSDDGSLKLNDRTRYLTPQAKKLDEMSVNAPATFKALAHMIDQVPSSKRERTKKSVAKLAAGLTRAGVPASSPKSPTDESSAAK